MNNTWLEAIPNRALCRLRALQEFWFMAINCCVSEIQFDGFKNLTNLKSLNLFLFQFQDTNSRVFLPLGKLPIRTFAFGMAWFIDGLSMSKEVFAPLTNITYLQTSMIALPAMVSVHSCLQNLSTIIGQMNHRVKG